MERTYPLWQPSNSGHPTTGDDRATSDGTPTLSAAQSQDNPNNGFGAASPAADPDHALVAACCAGNKQAFDVLVLRHQDFVSTLATRLLRDPHEAKDLTQDTFLRAYEKIEEFRGEVQFSTWLHRICCNLCLNRLKKKTNQLTDAMGMPRWMSRS